MEGKKENCNISQDQKSQLIWKRMKFTQVSLSGCVEGSEKSQCQSQFSMGWNTMSSSKGSLPLPLRPPPLPLQVGAPHDCISFFYFNILFYCLNFY